MTYSLNHRLTFGKYRGEVLKHVIEKDMNYIRWAYVNVDWLKFDNDALKYAFGEKVPVKSGGNGTAYKTEEGPEKALSFQVINGKMVTTFNYGFKIASCLRGPKKKKKEKY